MSFPVNELMIITAETALGVRFPSAYRARLMHENGGLTQIEGEYWELFPVRDTSDNKRLKRTCNDLVQETKSLRNKWNIPPNAVVIGENGSGDYLLYLSIEGETTLQNLAVWRHEGSAIEPITDHEWTLQKVHPQRKRSRPANFDPWADR